MQYYSRLAAAGGDPVDQFKGSITGVKGKEWKTMQAREHFMYSTSLLSHSWLVSLTLGTWEEEEA